MSLSDFAQIVISSGGAALTQVGFGTLLCAGYHAHNTDLVREYTALTEMVTDSFTKTEPLYRMVARAFSQKPRPPSVKVGRLQHAPTHTVTFTPVVANNTVYQFDIELDASGKFTVLYTSDGSATAAEIVAGLITAFAGFSLAADFTLTNGTTVLTIATTGATAAAGKIAYYHNWTNMAFADTTADPGFANDLNAIETNDADWYGLAVDCQSKATIEASAAWAESEGLVIAAFNTSDSAVYDNTSTTDVAAQMKALSYARTILYFSLSNTDAYSGVAGFAERSTHDPGKKGAGGTWHARTLVGVPADGLTPTIKAHLRAKNVVPHISTAGRNHTLDGKCIGGEFIDKIRFLDWFSVRLQERIATAELNNDKIPFDDVGISIMLDAVNAQGALGEAAQGFVAGSFAAAALTRAQTDQADVDARTLTSITFEAELSGAIHLVAPITGTVV